MIVTHEEADRLRNERIWRYVARLTNLAKKIVPKAITDDDKAARAEIIETIDGAGQIANMLIVAVCSIGDSQERLVAQASGVDILEAAGEANIHREKMIETVRDALLEGMSQMATEKKMKASGINPDDSALSVLAARVVDRLIEASPS